MYRCASPLFPSDGAGEPIGTIICFSHLRWDFVFQRPQQLMTRLAREVAILFWEEPKFVTGLDKPGVQRTICKNSGVTVLTPLLRDEDDRATDRDVLVRMLDEATAQANGRVVKWYYTPMMYPFSAHVMADCVVYDCMDELANFRHAPSELLDRETLLIAAADLIFTGGPSLYETKRGRHGDVHCFPSSVDTAHFAGARADGVDPADQRALARPRFGFYGVIDERIDLDLLAAIATARPDWNFVIVGPVVKIDPATLPALENVHFLGPKPYDELPDYLRGWDAAIMPFAINDATRFISPTKTPEYLAAGKPVVSTAIADVIQQYDGQVGVRIATTSEEFVAACEEALSLAGQPENWLLKVDVFLARTSWDATAAQMAALIRTSFKPPLAVAALPAATGTHTARACYDVMIVGAGFAGAVMAERLATVSGKRVLVIDKRSHIAGNAYDRRDDGGLLIHQYGPHIFHTNSSEVFDYLSRFTEWRPYEHRVLADIDGLLVPMPINRTTLNLLYNLDLNSNEDAAAFLAARAEPVDIVRTSADVVIAAVGRELYETFFQGYTRKQWGMDPAELDKSVTARVPTRTNTDDRYFTDTYQAMPAAGYTAMFARMLDHANIDVKLGVEYRDLVDVYAHDHLVFTGPIDEYFDHRYGKLPYRSLHFRHETLPQEQFQPVATVNYPSEAIPYTRITEYKHLTGQTAANTSVTYEYPSDAGDPYYPIPRPENQRLFKQYEALAMAEPNVTFVGRLATYRYYNMDQVVGQALATYRRLAERLDAVGPEVAAVAA